MLSRFLRTLAGLVFGSILLSGCGGHMAPVSERSLNSPPTAPRQTYQPAASGYYRVQSGDTLYSIAWRYRKDYRALARANGIDSSFRIYTGQQIRLSEAVPAKPSPTRTPKSSLPASRPQVSPRAAKAVAAKPRQPVSSGPITWRWPSKGTVVQRFSAKGKLNKGLNIAGNRGDPVLSAATGVVVYAGNGLLGYGNLIIINHNDSFLSAYAHNDKLLVKEQQRVSVGQKIAEIGNSGAAQTMLHFEIRKEGKPVDPSRYLPRR